MKTLLVWSVISAIIFFIIAFFLLLKIRVLYKQLKYVDNANMWHKMAITDDLTGLYNRNAYNMKIDKIKNGTSKKLRGIIVFDVDDFKKVNDTRGHLAGDAVLKKVAQSLFEIFEGPKYDVFRIGGDEFAVISEDADGNEIIERLIVLKEHLETEGDIRLSKGYSLVEDNWDEAFKCADEMLYADKLAKRKNDNL